MNSRAQDLSAIVDEHVADEFVAKDVAGGVGAGGVADFYDKCFIGHWPADTTIIPVCRIVGAERVVDKMIMSFTHEIPMPTFLPGGAPTGRAVLLPVVVMMGFDADSETPKVAY